MDQLLRVCTNPKTGTVVKTFLVETATDKWVKKLISYGENTPLRKLGIGEVSIDKFKGGYTIRKFWTGEGSLNNENLFEFSGFKCEKPTVLAYGFLRNACEGKSPKEVFQIHKKAIELLQSVGINV